MVEAGQYQDTNPRWQRNGQRCPLLMPRLGLYSGKANQELAYGFRHDGILHMPPRLTITSDWSGSNG
jgi:hypothetical protein